MLVEWLEPYIEKVVLEVIEDSEEITGDFTQEINQLLDLVEVQDISIRSQIENAFLMKTRFATELAVRIGINKGIEVGKCLK